METKKRLPKIKNFVIKGTVKETREFLDKAIEIGFVDNRTSFEKIVDLFNVDHNSKVPVEEKNWGLAISYEMTFGIVRKPQLDLGISTEIKYEKYDTGERMLAFHLPKDYDKALKECLKLVNYYKQKDFRVIQLECDLKAKVMKSGEVELTQKCPNDKVTLSPEKFLSLVQLVKETDKKLDELFPENLEHKKINSQIRSIYLSTKNLNPLSNSQISLMYDNYLMLNQKEELIERRVYF